MNTKKSTFHKHDQANVALTMEIKTLAQKEVEQVDRLKREDGVNSFNRRESFIDYKDLAEGIRGVVSFNEFASADFQSAAKVNGFSPYQWAGVVYLTTVSGGKMKIADFQSIGEWGLVVDGNLDLTGCTSVTGLPEGMIIKGSASLSGCINLEKIPEGLTVGGALWLDSCVQLKFLPANLTIGTGLSLHSCKGIGSLPAKIKVNGWLTIANCTRQIKMDARRLKEKGHIRGWIYTS